MTERLAGVIRKINRADDHIRFLHERIQAFVDDENAYALTTEVDRETGDIVFWGESRIEPPVIEWSIVVGDVVHNLRSALDALVWELSDQVSGPAPSQPARDSPWSGIGFPIVYSAKEWPEEAFKKLPAVGIAACATIRRLQPFYTRKTGSVLEQPLAMLQKLWNIDKHRHPNLIAVFSGFSYLDVAKRMAGAQDALYRVRSELERGPLVGRTELARIQVVSAKPIVDGGVEMEHHLAFDIAFDEGPPGYGRLVMDTLESIRDTVIGIVAELQPHFP